MAEYKHGEMNIDAHEKTFVGFVRASRNVIILAIAILIFLAIFNS